MRPPLRDWARGLPKPELHVHLEGTISPQTYARIARQNGMSLDGEPAALFACTDFPSFLRSFLDVVRCLRRPEDFAEVATEFLRASAADGVRHVELLMSPATQRRFVPDLDLSEAVAALDAARRDAYASLGISSLVVFDVVRNLGEEEAFADLALAEQCRGLGVVGIGLGGDEANFPAREFARTFARAKALGLRRTVHAGEAAGAFSIVDAVTLLEAERIGHGVAARARPEVIELIRERSVAIDACPKSNAITGALGRSASHPLREFFDAGLTVTLNSDDPAFFGASLLDEYVGAVEALGFTREELAAVAKMGFAASFAPEARKRAWMAEVDAYLGATPV